MNQAHESGNSSWWRSGRIIWLLVLLGIAGLILLPPHRAHLFSILPYLLLLACPFMHFFMHRGHGHHGGGGGNQH